MNDAVIIVENLSKKYRIKHYGETSLPRYSALRDVIASKFTGLFENRKSKTKSRKSVEDFWALKDVSFEVHRGEVIGIIGRNGAGKTTLLKILSRITEPTEGRVRIKGRVASLLEVGTGFHPELTGRENIFLNGAMLGMTRAEIKRKFDEIVAFAETEKFLDTPVKRYSSGMYVRLAFAVAAHLEPDILIVDEVLAVGDAQFQQKCLGKMQNVALDEGRTVLFVSHNMGAIRNLCSTVELLADGRIEMRGAPRKVIAHFLRSGASRAEIRWTNGDMPGDDTIKLHMVRITDTEGCGIHMVDGGSGFVVEMEYEIFRKVRGLEVGFRLSTVDGTAILTTDDKPSDYAGSVRLPGRYLARCQMPAGLLSSQTYCFSFGAHEPNVRLHYLVEAALELVVSQTLARAGNDPSWGVICPTLPWAVSKMK